MADGIFNFNRPRREIDSSSPDERGRDFEGNQSHMPDQGATDRRDPGADALSELARLIGQSTPVSGRADEVHKPEARLANVSRGAPSLTAAASDVFNRPPAREEPTQSHEDRSYRDPLYQDRSHRDPPYQDQSSGDRSSEDRFRQRQSYEGRSLEGRSSLDRVVPTRRDPDFAPRAPVQPAHPDADHSETPHAGDNFDFLQLPGRGDHTVAPRYAFADEGDYDRGDHRGSALTMRNPGYGRQHEDYADEYHEHEYEPNGEYETEHEDQDDGELGAKRRSSTKVVVAVLGLAVFGSAAAFGYRTVFKAAPSGPTPIIRADNSPTKVTPTGIEANLKPANGRLGEQLVRRDEEPVDVGSSYRSGADTGGSSPTEIVPATVGPVSSGDPRRVRTVTIRSDQGAASSDRTASRASPPPQSQPAPPSPRQAAVSPPPITGGVPAATAPDVGGGFVVQLSAQRSEAEAQTAFRTLQAKYSVLSGRQLLVRRKDQGEKGIFYAAQVGPFGTRADAAQLCESLKAAGGNCFIPKD
jgi:cell division septation protein DedD